MKTAVLVGPSVDLRAPQRQAWVRREIHRAKPSYLGAVDGGITFLERGVDLVIGDWDSGDPERARKLARAGAKMISLPKRKDFSDLHFALEALPRDADELRLIGFTGGRPDHLLANLFEIAEFAAAHASRAKYQKIAAIGPEAEYHFLTEKQPALQLGRVARGGATVSVFAIGAPARGVTRGVTMTGFEYEIKNAVLEPSSRGLSNRVRTSRAEIRVKKGTLVVVIPHGI